MVKKLGKTTDWSVKQETEVIVSKNKFLIFFYFSLPITTIKTGKINHISALWQNVQWYLRGIPFFVLA